MDSKVPLRGAYSADQRSAVRWIGERTPGHWSDGASLGCSCRSCFGQPPGRLSPGWPRPSCDSSEDPDPDALTPGGPRLVPLGAAIGDSPAQPPCRPPFTETTARPLAPPAAPDATLSKGDRQFLYPTHIDIPPDLGCPIIEDDFDVKSTARCIVYTCPYRTDRR